MMAKCTDKANFNGKMVHRIKGNINLVKSRELANLLLSQRIIIKDVGSMASKMVEEFYMIKMESKLKMDIGNKGFFKENQILSIECKDKNDDNQKF